jgi:hypothetical protein
MTATEIRKLAPEYSASNGEQLKVILLREIAAQLADFQEYRIWMMLGCFVLGTLLGIVARIQ